MHATLDEFLDRRRAGLASTFLTRLKVGPRPRRRGRRAAALRRRGAPAAPARRRSSPACSPLGAAIGVTPVGQEWVDDARPVVTDATTDLIDDVRGLLP